MFIIKKEFRFIFFSFSFIALLVFVVTINFHFQNKDISNNITLVQNLTKYSSIVNGSSFLENRYIEQKDYQQDISSQLPNINYRGFIYEK